MLEAKNISLKFEHKWILKDINLEIRQNENIALLGVSGAGKTSFGKILCNLLPATNGSVYYEGLDIKSIHPKVFYKNIQMLFQDPIQSLNPHKSILENLCEPLIYLLDEPTKNHLEILKPILDKLSLSTDILDRYPFSLSGGEAKRVNMARILCIEPKLLILDEGTSGLDFELSASVVDVLKSYHSKCSILCITHDRFVAKSLCQKIYVLRDSKLYDVES